MHDIIHDLRPQSFLRLARNPESNSTVKMLPHSARATSAIDVAENPMLVPNLQDLLWTPAYAE